MVLNRNIREPKQVEQGSERYSSPQGTWMIFTTSPSHLLISCDTCIHSWTSSHHQNYLSLLFRILCPHFSSLSCNRSSCHWADVARGLVTRSQPAREHTFHVHSSDFDSLTLKSTHKQFCWLRWLAIRQPVEVKKTTRGEFIKHLTCGDDCRQPP